MFVPLSLSEKTQSERVADRVRDSLTAAGFFEAITLSFISREMADLIAPWGLSSTSSERLSVDHSSRRQENVLRQSLVPSLLVSRRENERQGTFNAKLFEIASVYLAAKPGDTAAEPRRIGFVTGSSFLETKGVIQTLAKLVNPQAIVTVQANDQPHFVPGRGAEILLDGQSWGWLGELSRSVTNSLDLRDSVVAGELDVSLLEASANLVPKFAELPRFPAVTRDINFVLDESVTWEQLTEVARSVAGPFLDGTSFGGQYRGQQIPPHKKSYVVNVSFRALDRTLTSEEVDTAVKSIIDACTAKLGAMLR